MSNHIDADREYGDVRFSPLVATHFVNEDLYGLRPNRENFSPR